MVDRHLLNTQHSGSTGIEGIENTLKAMQDTNTGYSIALPPLQWVKYTIRII